MNQEIILDKRKAVEIIFYNGTNKDEVIEFFKHRNYGKYLVIIDNELHYKINDYDRNTLIEPNFYISFVYDEDNWWTVSRESKDSFDKNFVSIDKLEPKQKSLYTEEDMINFALLTTNAYIANRSRDPRTYLEIKSSYFDCWNYARKTNKKK